MGENRTDNKLRKIPVPIPAKAMLDSLPIALAAVAFLWSTGYPVEEWPFVGGSLYVCLLGSGTLVGRSALYIAKRLDRYGRSVALEIGIDMDAHRAPSPVRGITRFVIAAVIFSILTGAVWGLALNALSLVMSRLEMAPLGANLGVVALALLCVGFCGLVLVFGLAAAVFYLASARSRRLLSALMRARASAVLGLERGVPFYGGTELSWARPGS